MNKKIFVMILGLLFLSGCLTKGEVKNVLPAEVSTKESSNECCQKACDNYVDRCLNLVPNADHVMFEEGQKSCLTECADWANEKVECISVKNDCPSMTTECEL
ncbi:MAG: hypothetical protein WCT18_02580 [Patescibacteria group bacterium]